MSNPEELPLLASGLSLRGLNEPADDASHNPPLEPMATYEFSSDQNSWVPSLETSTETTTVRINDLAVSTYNVLAESARPLPRDRYDALAESILSADALADVVVLEEVCDSCLAFLLSREDIRRRYPFVTHGSPGQEGSSPHSGPRNTVVLSQWRFFWSWQPFEARHEGAAILKIDGIGDLESSLPTIIVALHLTPGLTDAIVDERTSQIRIILSLLSRDYPDNPSIVVGNFNFPTSQEEGLDTAFYQKNISLSSAEKLSELNLPSSEARFVDAWAAGCTGSRDALKMSPVGMGDSAEDGKRKAMFDPTQNNTAVQSSTKGRPRGYGRITVRQSGKSIVTDFNFFGLPDDFEGRTPHSSESASDHWGFRARVRFGRDLKGNKSSEMVPRTPLKISNVPKSLSTLDAIESFLRTSSMVPSEEDRSKRERLVATLSSILTEPIHDSNGRDIKTPLVLITVGSYGLGTWNPNSDIDCLCIGAISSNTFFTLAIQRLRRASDQGIRIMRKVKAATGTMLELRYEEIKLDLQYCPAGRIAERWQGAMKLPPQDPIFDLSLYSLMKLQPLRDQEYLKRTIPDMHSFRLAHRCITSWAKASGIYSSKFGLLGGVHITMMLARLHNLLQEDIGRVSVPELVPMFFSHYANFDWQNQVVAIPGRQHKYRRSSKEPMVILTVHAPTVNVARAVTAPSLRTVVTALKRAEQLLAESGATWMNVLRDTSISDNNQTGADKFLTAYNSYVKVSLQYWGPSVTQANSVVGWLESRFFRLLYDLDKNILGIHGRIWPARFSSQEVIDGNVGETEYQGCYLIGLERLPDVPGTVVDGENSKHALQATLDRFKAALHEESKYFDPTVCWIDVTHAKQTDLGELKLDFRSWGEKSDGAADFSEEEEANDDDLGEGDDVANALLSEDQIASRSKTWSKTTTSVSKPVGASKLRPAADVISRLRWDPKIDAGDYIVGYEDRFLGVKETPLTRWKSEQTDEEFIPQHRIVYFKRKSDGQRVWDRETRKDEIFGSGTGRSTC